MHQDGVAGMKKPLAWQIATVTAIRQETPKVKTYTFRLPDWQPHAAGQHYDIRLTAPDGYQAQRSYSVASEPERKGEIDLTVEWIEDGEVSSYLHQGVVVGDQVELRGPIGGYFVWRAEMGGPLLLIGGGSGVVPLMAMLRHRARAGSRVPTRLLYSLRTPSDLIYASELEKIGAVHDGLEVFLTFTRAQPPGWKGFARRIDQEMLGAVIAPLGLDALTYICGPTLLVEAAADFLIQIGVQPQQLRTERFGPTGSA